MAEKYQRFGKYLILDHLVDGGMAKICLASYLGEQANKIVAIKMVQPQFSKNESFVQMFEDELKVTFGLLHPNIAQVYDYGMVDEQLFSAMEYVDGANLKQYLDRLKKMKYVFPVEISTYIISQVAQALHYAHSFQDKLTGKPFNIIHRDISPHNIMLTYDGAVKVIDFGIAKADSNSEATQAGTIKGKLSYLAPEYLEGIDLDHRYDQFAVGITLWEMLCSRKLFTAKNDLAVLKLIQACKIPKPSSINPNVPPELDEIVLKALSKDRNQRYENMDKLNRALVKFLYSNFPDFNATDLSYFASQLFKEEIDKDKRKFVEFGKIDLKPYIAEMQSEDLRPSDTGILSESTDLKTKNTLDLGTFDKKSKDDSMPALDLDFSKTKTRAPQHNRSKNSTKPQSRQERIAAKAGTRSGVKTKTKTTQVSRKSLAKKKGGNKIFPVLVVAGVMMLAVFKPELLKSLLSPSGTQVEVKKEHSVVGNKNSNSTNKVTEGKLIFRNFDPTMKIKINGEEVSVSGISASIKLNKELSIAVYKPGYKKWVKPETVTATTDKSVISITIPDLKKDSIGFLTTSQNFSPGSKIQFELDGDKVEKDLPLKNERLPAGEYEAVIVNPLLNTKRKIKFSVQENKRNFLEQ